MRALACPASLKGVLSASAAAEALASGFAQVGVVCEELPIADGGEGTAEVLHAALDGEWRDTTVADPLGRPIRARWLVLPDGTAVVEAAAAIGLPLLGAHELDPLRASSRGFGELVAAALASGARSVLLCLGGVATVDGGAGLREILRGSEPLGTVRARVDGMGIERRTLVQQLSGVVKDAQALLSELGHEAAEQVSRPGDHQCLLACLSDYWLAGVAAGQHRSPITADGFSIVSLNHSLWFHAPARADQWLLYRSESPWAGDGRGIARALLYDREGTLIASVAQEAALRDPKS